MIPLLLAFAFAVHPPTLEAEGKPGELVSLPLTLLGDAEVQIQGAGALEADDEARIHGKEERVIEARISPRAQPGTHTAYLYISSAGRSTVRTASAVQVELRVHDAETQHRVLEGTADAFAPRSRWIAAGAAVLGVAALFATGAVRVTRR